MVLLASGIAIKLDGLMDYIKDDSYRAGGRRGFASPC